MTIALPSTGLLLPYDESPEITVNESPAGDGYELVQTIGINPVRRVYKITWIPMDAGDAHTIRDVLLGTNYTETVTWTPDSEGTERNFRVKGVACRWVTPTQKQVSCTLREKFV